MRVGTVNVNGGVWYSADVPFGGYKQSGIGREMGLLGFEEYLDQDNCHSGELTPIEEAEGMRFEDKVAIVTGSGGGIGQAYAEALAREGAAVVVADINAEGAEGVAEQHHRRGRHGNRIARGRFRSGIDQGDGRRTLSEFGGIDYLVNNAAIFGGMKLDFLLTVTATTTRSS